MHIKLRLFFSILLVATTTFISIHELKHINKQVSDVSCEICMLSDNLNSADISIDILEDVLYSYEFINLNNFLLAKHIKKSTNHSTAPPTLS